MKILTALELSVVLRELQMLVGARVQKIYQPSSKELLFYLYKNTEIGLKIDSGIGCYLTSYKLSMPTQPQGFCMFLRKNLNGSVLKRIEQKGYERIIELEFEKGTERNLLICELFSKGNFVLTDKNYLIKGCASIQKWKDRTIRTGLTYEAPPPLDLDYGKITDKNFLTSFKRTKHEKVGQFLGSDIALGNVYSLEICKRANIDALTPMDQINNVVAERLFMELKKLLIEFSGKPAPHVIFQNNEVFDAVPFMLSLYANNHHESFDTYNLSLDHYYTNKKSISIEEKKSSKYEEKKTKLHKIIDAQKTALNELMNQSLDFQRKAELIYKNYTTLSEVINKIKSALKAGNKWSDIAQVLAKEREKGIYEAEIIEELKPELEEVVINIDEKITLNINKSLEENAGDYYDAAKKLKSKMIGAEDVVKKTENELNSINKEDFELKMDLPKKVEKVKREWYEIFRWFYTSSGLLAVGGRDATSNEILVKRYAEIHDLIFHTEMTGSPFFIFRNNENKKFPDKDINEVASATASFSGAWREGLGTTEVYWVRPEQLSKTTEPGEYISRGSFVVRGKRNYVKDVACRVAIGLFRDKLMSGAESAIRKHCEKYIVLQPGDRKSSDLAKELIEKLGIQNPNIDTIIRALPSGDSMIQKNSALT